MRAQQDGRQDAREPDARQQDVRQRDARQQDVRQRDARQGKDVRQQVGRLGEDLAAHHLTGLGWRVLDRNWYGRAGELDIVALDVAVDEVVGVEVKTRRSSAYGSPAGAVTPTKVRRMRVLTAQWLAEHDVRCTGVRLDVVAVELVPHGPPRVEHLVGVA
jgi:putative endonuclease